jgi:hypothetical protein
MLLTKYIGKSISKRTYWRFGSGGTTTFFVLHQVKTTLR